MANTPNMNLILPDVEVTPGPEWATQLNAALFGIDNHDHSSGKGVRVTPAGLNVNSDLPFNNNNAIDLRTARFNNPSSFTPGVTDRAALTAYGNELFFVDGVGNEVQITSNGALDVSGVGGITGMAGTTASVVYSDISKTFSFFQGPSSSALLYAGGLNLWVAAAAANSLGLRVSPTITNWNMTFPDAPPSSSFESSGNNSKAALKIASTGTVSVDALAQVPLGTVLPLSVITGSYICTATTVADEWGYVLCNGQTLNDPTSPMNLQIMPDLNLITGGPNYLTLTHRWIAYTPSIGSVATFSNIEFYYRRVADTMEIRGRFTPSSLVSSIASISLPPGHVIDANKIDVLMNSFELIGRWGSNINGTNVVKSGSIYVSLLGSISQIFMGGDDSYASNLSSFGGFILTSNASVYSIFATQIPISQWVDLPKNQIKYIIRVK